MGFNVGIKDIILSGGVPLLVMVLLSIYSIALIWERWRFFKRSTAELKEFLGRLRRIREGGDLAEAGMQRGMPTLGTIASTAPFIGLFGTVVGVMRAFKDLAGAAGAGPGVVAIGISEALVCTAAGLFVAIPAVAAYNYFNNRTQRFAEEMSWVSEEILESLSEKTK